jgi:hypothetical protein
MAAENIGTLVPTKIPGYSDAADIQAALRLYHYGSYTFDTAESNAANLVNPSVAYTINDLQSQIDDISGLGPELFTSKGSLLSASAASTVSLLAVGANGTVLTANSGTATGLEWATPSVTASNSVTLTGKTISYADNTLTGVVGLSATQTLTGKTLTAPVINLATNAQTASYSLVLSDASKIVEVSVGSANTLTIPTNASQAFPIGTQILILQTNTGQTTLTAAGGVTVNATPGLKLRTQWSSAVLVKRATDTWVALGDLVA